jgi:hypothetical protein
VANGHPGRWTLVPVLSLVVTATWPVPHRADRSHQSAGTLALHEEASAADQPAIPESGKITEINFKWLSFPLRPELAFPITGKLSYEEFLPLRIKRFEGANIRIRGFMVPTLNEGGKVREFMILPSQMTCCFGQSPRFCEFISARMRGSAVPAKTDEPVAFEGVFHAGDVYVNGYWSTLYTLDCTQVSR